MNETPPPQTMNLRPLPRWAWVIATLFFPTGVFLALGYVRLLSWMRSITLAVLSYACLAGLARLMAHLEEIEASGIARSLALTGGHLLFCVWGYLIFRIGQKVAYWSPVAIRGWRRAAWFALVVLVLCVVSLILQTVLSRLQPAQ